MHPSRLAPLAALLLLSAPALAATQVDITGPPGSGAFGTTVNELPNRNIVVIDPGFDLSNPTVSDVGAVYLYNPDGLLISSIRGSTANDAVGSGGIIVFSGGFFIIRSNSWDNGSASDAGAVTWGSFTTGFIGGPNAVVSPANSLVGSTSGDQVGSTGITGLLSGNYIVRSSLWNNGPASDAGAVTWGNGATGVTGTVSPANSLVGSSSNDQVGSTGVSGLPNGNYVVLSSVWDNTTPATPNAGAVTWANGTTGITGPVSATNSLVGSSSGDSVGSGITTLTNGNYVVRSPLWDNGSVIDAGAATWAKGTTGISGPVSPANSLVGTTADDSVGFDVTALTNGNYVVRSPEWNNTAATTNAGAVTWGNGNIGISGPVSAANSLVGTNLNDGVGNSGVTALTNGNYVVSTPFWDNGSILDAGILNAGAVTWANGTTGITGTVTPANSLVGTSTEDQVGIGGVTALTNGNYVVRSFKWDNGLIADPGAVTWGNGTTGIKGTVSPANSLFGSSAEDQVGRTFITALTNGNYVVSTPLWDNPASAASNAGAVTWGNGTTGIKGPVSTANSLVGSSAEDQVGTGGVTALTNGNYVVRSQVWDNTSPTAIDAGAVTWGNGTTGIKGTVSPANSLVGSSANDSVGNGSITALTNGNYVVRSQIWDSTSPPVIDVGAVTWANGTTGLTGPVSPANSLVGTNSGDNVGSISIVSSIGGAYFVRSPNWDNGAINSAGAVSLGNGSTGTNGFLSSANSVLGTIAGGGAGLSLGGFDPARNQLIVARPASNLVTLFRGDRLRSLAKTSFDAPGAADIAFATSGTAAVNPLGATLSDSSLTGSGSSSGRNRALFAFSPSFGTDLVLQSGTPLSVLGAGLPANTTASALFGQLFNRTNFSLFQATVKGTGITTANNRLLLLDNGVNVQLLQRTGIPIPSLANASFNSFTEVLQNHDQDLITLAYKLKPGGTVNATNDEGLLFLNHNGTIAANLAAREGQPGFGIGGTFGAFTGRAASALGDTIFFTSLFKPTGASPIPAVHSTNLSGSTKSLLVASDASAPNSNGATFGTFPAITHQSGSAIVRATLKGSSVSQNEGLYSLPTNVFLSRTLLTRKGDPIGGGVNIARILRFWPAGLDQLILQVQVTGTNVNTTNNQVLLLRQSDGTYLTLLRTGTPAPGTGPARLAAISAVDVNPVTGLYAILGTLSGAPSSSNQALWTGDPKLGNNTTLQILRLPQLTLRKGNPYSTESTPSGIIRSIALKPAIDPTGAGGRGLAQALGASGDLALLITTDRNLTELVLLDR